MFSATKPYAHKVAAFYISILNDFYCSTGEFDQIMVSDGCCGIFGLNQLSRSCFRVHKVLFKITKWNFNKM